MFKVPDWGNDTPKGDVEVLKLFTKKNKAKTIKENAKHKTKDNVKSQKTIRKKKYDIRKPKNMANDYTILSKDDHIKNRILKRNLKMTSDKKSNLITETKITDKAIIKDKKIYNNNDVHERMKTKILNRKQKVPNHLSNNEKQHAKKSNIIITNQNKHGFTNKVEKEPQTRKRKTVNQKKQDDIDINNADIQNIHTDELDTIIVNAKRKKLNDKIKKEDIEDELFGDKDSIDNEVSKDVIIMPPVINKVQRKKEKLKHILKRDSNRNVIRTNSNNLRERMLERLKAAQFRYLNEKLYTSSGSESQELFKSDPAAFQTYHEGYQLQVKKWPVNPLDLIVKRIQKMPKTHLIADMGCGEAALAKRVPQSVRSFDLVATAPGVEACNMAHTPLLAASVDVVVFCLALMGTDLTQYLLEANRVLKTGGHLLIAEVESRFENVDLFSSDVQRLGFSLKKVDKSHQVFFFMEFNKVRDAPAKKAKLPTLSLKPCLYKRR